MQMNAQTTDYRTKDFEGRNLAFFFLLAFGISWTTAVLIAVLGLDMSTNGSGPINPLVVLIGVTGTIGPSLAAFIVTGFSEGKAGVKALWKRFWNRNMSLVWLIVILSFYNAFRLIANLVARVVDQEAYPIVDPSTPIWMSILALVAAFIYSGVAEEFGWRGYALPRFQARWSALTSSIVLGLIWMSWHVPFFFIPGLPLYQGDFWGWAPWLLMASFFQTWFFNNTKGSVLAAALFHATMNASLIILPTKDSLWYYYALLFVAVIFIVVIFGPKNLVRRSAEDKTPMSDEIFIAAHRSP
jgi:uncharacterized protein